MNTLTHLYIYVALIIKGNNNISISKASSLMKSQTLLQKSY